MRFKSKKELKEGKNRQKNKSVYFNLLKILSIQGFHKFIFHSIYYKYSHLGNTQVIPCSGIKI